MRNSHFPPMSDRYQRTSQKGHQKTTMGKVVIANTASDITSVQKGNSSKFLANFATPINSHSGEK